MSNKRPTIYDLAEALGLSAATVSRALNDSHLINEETRERVKAYAREHGYRPNRLARSLILGKTRTIGVIVGDVVNPFFSELIAALQLVAEKRGYDLLLGNTGEDPLREERTVSLFIEKQVDGLILAAPRAAERQLAEWQSRIPIVLMNRRTAAAIPSVSVDSARGAEMATMHLLASGRRKLLYLGGPELSEANKLREEVFRDTVKQVPQATAVYRNGPASADTARNIVEQLLLGEDGDIDGIVAYDDLMAAGALQAVHNANRRVPEDIAIVGFDDIQLARLVSPSLTTVSQPLADMAQMAIDLLLEAVRGTPPTAQMLVEPHLVVRRSAPTTLPPLP